jgi:hypothetical protein
VNLAASLGWHFASQNADVSFLVSGQGRFADIHEFLAILAVIELQNDFGPGREPGTGVAQGSCEEAMLRETDLSGGEYNIILSARPLASFPPAFWSLACFISLETTDAAPMK